MSDYLHNKALPILDELGKDLASAFRKEEVRCRASTLGPRGSRKRLTAIALVAASASGIAILFGLMSGVEQGHLMPYDAQAQTVLSRTAEVAQARPASFPLDTQFFYVRSVSTLLVRLGVGTLRRRGDLRTLPAARVMIEQRTWASASRVGVTRERILSERGVGSRGLPAPRFDRADIPGVFPGPMKIAPLGGRYLLGNLRLTRSQLLGFTTDPKKLYAALFAAGGSAGEVFTEIGDALRNRPEPAPLRSALYRALARVPHLRYLGVAADLSGRRGVGVGLSIRGLMTEIIFDPTTSQMLGERTVVVDAGAAGLGFKAGTVLADIAYLQRSIADSATG